MAKKPTNETLEQMVKELEKESVERKRIEEKLEEKEQALKALLNAPPETAILVDLEGTTLAINEIAAKRVGKNVDELIGLNLFEYLPHDVAAFRKTRGNEVVRSGKSVRFQDERAGRFYDNNIYPVFDVEEKVTALAIYARDITESKRTEEALRESEERFSKAFQSNPNPLLISTLTDGRCIDVNEDFLRAFGYSREEVIGRTSSELKLWVDPNDRLKVIQALEQGMKVMLPEAKVRAKSGEIRIMMFAADKIELGGEECLITSATDITERVKAEEELHKYERIVAGSNDHMSLINRDYVYQVVNDAYLRSHNVKREDIVGHSVPELFGQEFFETHQKPMIDRCLAGEVVRYQSWIDFPTLGRRYMDIAHHPCFEDDGSISGYVVNARDITELKQAEVALRESEEQLHSLLQNIPAAVVVHGPDTKIIKCNKLAQELLGLTEDQMLGKKAIDPDWKFLNADGERMSLKEYPINKVLATRQPLRDLTVGIYLPNKVEQVWVLVNADPVLDYKGNIQQVIVTFMDITERKRIEEEREKLIKELQEALKEIKTLRGILPLCSFCKKIRDDKGYWEQVDVYIHKHSQADISHSICPECAEIHYPDFERFDD